MTYIMNRTGMSMIIEVVEDKFRSSYMIPPDIFYKANEGLVNKIKEDLPKNAKIDFFEDGEADKIVNDARARGISHISALERYLIKENKNNNEEGGGGPVNKAPKKRKSKKEKKE